MTDAAGELRRIAEQVAEALRDFGAALAPAAANAAALAAEMQRLRAAQVAAAADDPELVELAAALRPVFGEAARSIAEQIACDPLAPCPYPALRRAIRLALDATRRPA